MPAFRVLLCIWGWVSVLSAAPAVGLWPAVDSDLPPRADLVLGTLPNGVRYLILPHAAPQGHVSLRLQVACGSLVEADTERGIAHLIEHMAFRGTREHPDDTLVPALQRLGVGFGPDSAAYTGYVHTIFHLDLPQAGEAALREGLAVFREFATSVTFAPAALEQERGVVASEAKYRDTPTARRDLANLAFLFPDARVVRRPPIGDPAVLQACTRDQLVAFYDAWYRPERMAVIVVGDIDAAQVRRLVAAAFGGITARGPARPDPADVVPAAARPPDTGVFSDPGLTGCAFFLEHPRPRAAARDTHAARVRDLHRALADAMLERRLLKRSLEPRSTFVSPQVEYDDDSMPGWQIAGLGAAGRITDWNGVAAQLEQEHRRAFLHGFTAVELVEARQALRTQYDTAVRTAPTWDAAALADELADAVRSGRQIVDPAQVRGDLAAALAAATPEDCLQAFRAAWSTKAPDVFVAANPMFHVDPRAIVAELNRSRLQPVPAPSTRPPEPFAYVAFGRPGSVVADQRLADLDVHLARFANGVRLNFKPTRFDRDTVEVRVRVGEGKLAQPEDKPGLDVLAKAILLPGGLGRHSFDAVADLMSVTTVNLEFNVETDACVFTGRCAPRDLRLCLEMIAAYLTDAAFRPEALRAAHGGFGSMYASLEASPAGPLSLEAGRLMAGGDRRFGMPRPAELDARTIDEVKAWLGPQLQHGALETSIVGDITWREVEGPVAATLGALPARAPRRAFAGPGDVHPGAPPLVPQVYGLPPLLKQCGVGWYWPVAPLSGFAQDRRYRLLSEILGERLRVRLREQLGATYTPSAAFEAIDGFPRLNWLTFYAEIEPGRLTRAMALIEREAMSLALSGPTEAEFVRAKQVYVREMTDDLQTNSYWGGTVLAAAQQKPEAIAAARNRATDIAAITRADLLPLCRAFDASTSYRFITMPPGAAAQIELDTALPTSSPFGLSRKM